MLHAITPNPALDVTYYLVQLKPGEVNRVENVAIRPGGKGLNVARVSNQAFPDTPVTCGGMLAGAAGRKIAELIGIYGPNIGQNWSYLDVDQRVDLLSADLSANLALENSALSEKAARQTRTSVTVVDKAGATVLNEPGPEVTDSDWQKLIAQTVGAVNAGDTVAICGSVPPGSKAEALDALIRALDALGAKVLVDTSGLGLETAAKAGAWLLKPNEFELAQVFDLPDTETSTLKIGAQKLLDLGAKSVVVSRGEKGLLAFARTAAGDEKIYCVVPPVKVEGNPTGAGDACVAALTQALAAANKPTDLAQVIPEFLSLAVALSAAAVKMPVAGEVDLEFFRQLLPQTRCIEL